MGFQEYFIYKGRPYGIGTKVKLSRTVEFHTHGTTLTQLKCHDDYKIQTYTFIRGTTDGAFTFDWKENESQFDWKYYAHSQAVIHNPDDEIIAIVEPVYVELVSWQHKAVQNMFDGKACVDVFGGVLTYITVMCIGTIFKGNWIIWIVSTIIFIKWLLNQYRT